MKWCLISLVLLPFAAAAQLHLAKIFSDNMVLQRNEPVHIWGKTTPGKKLVVKFAGEEKSTIVKKDSSWSVVLKKQKANAHPQSLFVTSDNEKLELHNLLIGDVWLCSGQSNMEWPMSKEMHWQQEKKNADQPLIRFNNPPPAGRNVFGVAYKDSLSRRLNTEDFYVWSSWETCDSNTIREMSAVAYFFAKTIVQKEHIPVGLINLSIGGAPIETFISREAMQNDTLFSKKLQGNWLENLHLPVWIRERGMQNVGTNPSGFQDDLGLNHAYKPGFAFESGVKPLLNFPIKGIIWYQGESNAQEIERVEEYAALSALMIKDYRKQWKKPDLPFYYVQLSSIDTIRYKGQLWPQFRNEQRKIMQLLPHTGMAVTADVGAQHDVHPTNKKVVGERLARWALNKTYNKPVVPSGPLVTAAKFKDGNVIVSFQFGKGLQTSDGKALRGFSLNGKTEAEAVIQKNTVVILAKEKPALVFYGWKPFSDANLVNAETLPASTFKMKVK